MSANTTGPSYHGVMISSTFNDLEIHRQGLIQSLNDYGLMHVAMENSPAQSDATMIESSLRMVRHASAYILIIGARYGQIPICSTNNPRSLSITELEFLEAQRLARPTLVFIMGDLHNVPNRDGHENDPVKQAKLRAFIERAKRYRADSELARVYCTFDSLDDLLINAGPALAQLKNDLDRTPTSKVNEAASIQAITTTLAPALYANPEYLGSHEFVGRADQLSVLSEWAQPSDRHSMLLFEAIGGSGKSILAWKWLTQDALDAREDWAGRFWYSFYERGAQTKDFLVRALTYTCGKFDPEWARSEVSDLAVQLLSQLRQHPWLFVLDGIERLLVDYNRFDAHYRTDEAAGTEDPLSSREPLAMVRDEDTELFRSLLSAGSSKILVTSRLLPRCMVNAAHQPLPGLLHQRLPGLRSEDAEALFRACGVFGQSQAIRAYLKENCDCHPLVIGVLAGLVNRFLPARGNFDRWRVAHDGGLALDMAQLDLVGRRSHILRHALLALPEAHRELLGMLAMMLNEFDYKVLVALNPTDHPDSRGELSKAIADLEERGFLLFDKSSGFYDLHPVVRSVVLGNLIPSARERAGERIIDYFSAAAEASMAEAQTLDELLPAVHLVHTNLTMGKFEAAWRTFHPTLYNALWLNIERSDRNLTLLRPFFSKYWIDVHDELPKTIQRQVLNATGVSLSEIGFYQETLSCDMSHFHISKEIGESVSISIYNIAWSMKALGRIAFAKQAYELCLRLAEAESDDCDLFLAHLELMKIEAEIGNHDAADRHWELANPLGRDWSVARYRQGRAEYDRLFSLHQRGSFDFEALSAAEEIAGKHRSSRQVRRKLINLRGQWHLQQMDYDLASAAFDQALTLARQAGLRDVLAETALALTRQRAGTLTDGKIVADELASEKDCAELELALLWESLGRTDFAVHHAKRACIEACAEGEPYLLRRQFDAANAIIGRASMPTFKCSGHGPKQNWPITMPGSPSPAEVLDEICAIIVQLREENAEEIRRHSNLSVEDRAFSRKGHLIHKLKAKDTTGRWAYYFVLVEPSAESHFLRAIEGDGKIDLEDFGTVIASCYGEEPNQEVRDYLYEKYNFRV